VKLRERERESSIYLKHWDLFYNSRIAREEKVKYYEILHPGHSCGNFYLYEGQDFVTIDERFFDFDFGFSQWEGTRLWTDGEKAQAVIGKGKKLVSFKLIGRAPSMKSIKVFFNDKPIHTIDMAAIKDSDLVKIPLPQSDAWRNLLLLELDKPSRPIDWTEGKNQDERVLGIMTENWEVE
jgi:hypothetical protein